MGLDEACGEPDTEKRCKWYSLSTREVAIIFLVTAFMIFLLSSSIPPMTRIRHNEITAAAALKQYAGAQHEFKVRNLSAIPGNSPEKRTQSYAADYHTLYFGKDENDQELHLIPETMLNARLPIDEDAPISGEANSRGHEPYEGYWFYEDVRHDAGQGQQFALTAFPVTPGTTGLHVFRIGDDRIVYAAGTDEVTYATASGQVRFFRDTPHATPASGTACSVWKEYDPDAEYQHMRFWKGMGIISGIGFFVLSLIAFVAASRTPKQR